MKSKSVGEQIDAIITLLEVAFHNDPILGVRGGMSAFDKETPIARSFPWTGLYSDLYRATCETIMNATAYLPCGTRYTIDLPFRTVPGQHPYCWWLYSPLYQHYEEWPRTDQFLPNVLVGSYQMNRLAGDLVPDFIHYGPNFWDLYKSPTFKSKCSVCQAENLENFFTSKRSRKILCPKCFDERQAKQLAKEVVE